MSNKFQDQVLALAAIAQASEIVFELATKGNCNQQDMETMINSLFVFDPKNTEEIYTCSNNLQQGLKIIQSLAKGNHDKKRAAEVIKYGFSLLHIQRKLSAKPEILSILRSRLEHIHLKKEFFSEGDTHSSLHAAISLLYQDTISTFKFRIQVNGQVKYLQQTAIADNIRSILLSGVRAALLWRQLGGKQWQLFLYRKQIYQAAQFWLDKSTTIKESP